MRYLKWILVSREEFDRFKNQDPTTLTDIQRAVRFYYLVRNGYASRIPNPSFSVGPTRRPAFNRLRIEEDLSAAHIRMSRTYIENMPYEKLIKRFDRPGTFFYIDPPYYGCENDYGKGLFSRDDFGTLNELLRGIEGRFILSINNTPEIRKIFKGFKVEPVRTSYSAGTAHRKSKKVTELLIRNY